MATKRNKIYDYIENEQPHLGIMRRWLCLLIKLHNENLIEIDWFQNKKAEKNARVSTAESASERATIWFKKNKHSGSITNDKRKKKKKEFVELKHTFISIGLFDL